MLSEGIATLGLQRDIAVKTSNTCGIVNETDSLSILRAVNQAHGIY